MLGRTRAGSASSRPARWGGGAKTSRSCRSRTATRCGAGTSGTLGSTRHDAPSRRLRPCRGAAPLPFRNGQRMALDGPQDRRGIPPGQGRTARRGARPGARSPGRPSGDVRGRGGAERPSRATETLRRTNHLILGWTPEVWTDRADLVARLFDRLEIYTIRHSPKLLRRLADPAQPVRLPPDRIYLAPWTPS